MYYDVWLLSTKSEDAAALKILSEKSNSNSDRVP